MQEPESRPAADVSRGWRRVDSESALLMLGLKALVFLFAWLSIRTLFDSTYGFAAMWDRWDSVHYQSLAEFGYQNEGERRFSVVFYPLYPWLVRMAAFVWRDYFLAAIFVSGLASIAAAVVLRRLAEIDQEPAVARQAVWFLAIFPTSYFLHISYTESLFLALVLGSILAARKDYWLAAGLLGALACLTRVNGLVLGPTLLVEAWLQYRQRRRLDWRWLWIGVVGFGFLGYLALNYRVTGNPFAFSQIMADHWYKKFTPPWVGIYDVWMRIPGINLTEGLQEFVYIVLGLVCTIWCWLRLRPTYAIWMTLNWLLITSTAFIVSVPRYSLTLFPIFILFARLAEKRPLAGALLSAASLLFLALYATKFAYGTWAF